jgi:hypothetical protein
MEVYGNIYKSPPLYHSVSQLNPIYFAPYLFKCIIILYFHLWIDLEWCSLLSGFLAKILYEFLISNMCSICQSVILFLTTLLQQYFEKYADVLTHCHYILKSIVDINYRPHEKCLGYFRRLNTSKPICIFGMKLQHIATNNNTSASYWGGPGLKSRPGNRLF